MNIFATVLTYPAPSANYRGESEENRSVIQKVTYGRFEYPIISPEAMRNALRETLSTYGLPRNRERLHNEEQLAVRFEDYPFPETFADDFFFGYLVADRGQIPDKVVKDRAFQFKRDSVLRMNLARAVEPYRHDALFTQSPLTIKNEKSPWQNATTSALLHRETVVTAFQYPFALNLIDCGLDDKEKPADGAKAPDGKAYSSRGEQHKDWLRHLLRAISELNDVAGNHARSYFEMAPASIVIRLTDSLVAGYETYGFKPDGGFPEVVDGILHGDYPGNEFYLGGQIVKNTLNHDRNKNLKTTGVNLFRMASEALSAVARKVCGTGFLEKKENGRRKLMLHLRLKAPFGAFRTFTAGSYRPTAPFITPSAAYGLILNVAGIESRHDDGQAAMTLMKSGLPRVEIALGAITFPETQSIYQQLHNYPVGATGKDRAKETKGAKYNIQPVQREFLSGLDAYLCLRGNESLEGQVREGLRHGARSLCEGRPRYGIPFLGDNNFMIDVLREEPVPGPAFWYRLLTDDLGPVTGRCRLTAWIDRADMTRTVAYLYAPTKDIVADIPEEAWTLIAPPAENPRSGRQGRKTK